jgi:hypothetical protein
MSRMGDGRPAPLEQHVIPLAHVAGMPVEELLPFAPSSGSRSPPT